MILGNAECWSKIEIGCCSPSCPKMTGSFSTRSIPQSRSSNSSQHVSNVLMSEMMPRLRGPIHLHNESNGSALQNAYVQQHHPLRLRREIPYAAPFLEGRHRVGPRRVHRPIGLS